MMDIYALASAFFKTPGVGGAVVIAVFGGACTIYYLLTRWIIQGGKKDEQ